MRDLVFAAMMLGLLPLAAARPFVGVLLWCWFSFMSPHREVWGFATGLPWGSMLFGVTVLGCVFAREPREWRMNGVLWFTVVFMVAITVTSLFGLAPPESVWSKWELTFKALLGVMLTGLLLTDRWRIHALVWVIVIALGYYAVKGGIFTLMNGGNYRVYGPADTMISDNNHAAVAFLVVLPLMNYLRLQSAHHLVRHGTAFAMVMTLFAALGSQSRGALLALIAVAAVFWWRSSRKVIGAAVLVVALAGGMNFMPESWWGRMDTIRTYEQDESSTERLRLWVGAWKLALDRPLVGSGFRGPYTREVMDRVAPEVPARAIHSIWFELLGEQGFPTFFIWLGMIIAAVVSSIRLTRLARGRPDLAWAYDLGRMVQVSFVAYIVGGSFLSLSYWDVFWTVLLIAPAALAVVSQQAGAAARSVAAASLPGRPSWRDRASPARAGGVA